MMRCHASRPSRGKAAALEEMNDKPRVVMENGKFCVFTEVFGPVLRRHFCQPYTKQDLQNCTAIASLSR